MEDRGMFKKNLFLFCALTIAYAPITADTFHEDDTVAKGSNKKCCSCCSLTVKNNAAIGGNLAVRGSEAVGGNLAVAGSVAAASFITASGGPLLNWAVFSNTSAVAPDTLFPWAATPATSITAGITNNAGIITLPIGGTFLVAYTARVTATGPIVPGNVANVALFQGSTGSGFNFINQLAVVTLEDVLIDADVIQSPITGCAIITTTSTADNQIELMAFYAGEYAINAAVFSGDANANMAILQLK
jgi:hypothetical protein